ncbi:MAG: zeta toxin family protein, partial [Nitrospirae bacterium]|nr:zeta toxin family protein [Nitrospirota bacterium]
MKEVYIIAGPNGSGKTTVADKLVKYLDLPFVNADEIEKNISRGKLGSMKIEAGKIYLRQINEYIKNNRSFVTETTLSGKNTTIINQLKTSGFTINICYLVV